MAVRKDSEIVGSACADGKFLKVAATASPGTAIHTTQNDGAWDVLTLWAWNTDNSARTLTVEWGGTTDGFLAVKSLSLGANSAPVKIVDGFRLKRGNTVAAFASSANVVNCYLQVDSL